MTEGNSKQNENTFIWKNIHNVKIIINIPVVKFPSNNNNKEKSKWMKENFPHLQSEQLTVSSYCTSEYCSED
jgi:hypothetical protein